MYKARERSTGRLVALKKTRLEVRARPWRRAAEPSGWPRVLANLPGARAAPPLRRCAPAQTAHTRCLWRGGTVAWLASPCAAQRCSSSFSLLQMEEEGVPSTALREVSLLQMLSESIFVVRCAAGALPRLALAPVASRAQNDSLGARPAIKGWTPPPPLSARPASTLVEGCAPRSPRRTLPSCPLA